MDYTNSFSLAVSMHNLYVQLSIRAMEQGWEQTALQDFEKAMAWWDLAKAYQSGKMPIVTLAESVNRS